jgi:hypothetical protein
METAQAIFDMLVKGGMLLAAVLYIERRLTRLETRMDELLEWKRTLSGSPFRVAGN